MKFLCPIICLFFLLPSCRKECSPPHGSHLPDTTVVSSTYYPAHNWGMLAYEDKWPLLNDYDMNDLVVSYQYRIDKNGEGKVVSLACNFAIDAVGANYLNGFAIQFPFLSAKVKSVSGELLTGNSISLNNNGTEAGLSNTVVVAFDNTENLITSGNSSHFVNVHQGEAKRKSDTAHLFITFATPMDADSLGQAPYDPFLISNMKRDHEIHLAGKTPTAKMDLSLFNQLDDDSKKGTTYSSAAKLPWALNFPDGNYKYPLDGKAVTATYLHFADYVASGGKQYTDWLTNASASYLNPNNLYR